jgi:hypothetical protein
MPAPRRLLSAHSARAFSCRNHDSRNGLGNRQKPAKDRFRGADLPLDILAGE